MYTLMYWTGHPGDDPEWETFDSREEAEKRMEYYKEFSDFSRFWIKEASTKED